MVPQPVPQSSPQRPDGRAWLGVPRLRRRAVVGADAPACQRHGERGLRGRERDAHAVPAREPGRGGAAGRSQVMKLCSALPILS